MSVSRLPGAIPHILSAPPDNWRARRPARAPGQAAPGVNGERVFRAGAPRHDRRDVFASSVTSLSNFRSASVVSDDHSATGLSNAAPFGA